MNQYRHIVARAGGIFLLACAFGVIGAQKSEAAFIAAICDDVSCSGGGDFTVTDGGLGDLAPGVPGTIAMTASTGGFSFVLNTANSKPVVGSAGAPALNFSYNAVSGGAANAWIYASDTDFVGTGFLSLIANATLGDTQTASAFGGNSNVALDLTNLLAGPAPFIAGVGGDASVVSATALTAPPAYSLTLGVNVVRSGAGASTGDARLSVPEPASLALFGLGLLGAGLASRRRKGQLSA